MEQMINTCPFPLLLVAVKYRIEPTRPSIAAKIQSNGNQFKNLPALIVIKLKEKTAVICGTIDNSSIAIFDFTIFFSIIVLEANKINTINKTIIFYSTALKSTIYSTV